MTMRKILMGVCLIVLATGDLWSRGIEAPSALVVLPARQRVVEFGFDLINRQDVTLIAYQQVGPDLLIHLWNGREWVPMTPAAYFSGTFLLGAPEQLILIGDDTLLPTIFQTAPDWSRKTGRIRALDIATLVNESARLLKFTDGEWKWFAEKYGLALTDSNASRRRWGKYGPPGKEWYRDQPPAKGETKPAVKPEASAAPAETTPALPERVIPDNVPVAAPATPVSGTVPTVAPPAAPVAPQVVPVPEVVVPPSPPTPPAALAPAVPAEPVAPAPAAKASDVLPPGTTVELPGK